MHVLLHRGQRYLLMCERRTMQNEKEKEWHRRERDEETINTPGDCSRCREDRCPLGREKAKIVKILGLFGHAKLARVALRENENEAFWFVSTVNSFLQHFSWFALSKHRSRGMVWEEKEVHRAYNERLYASVYTVIRSLSTTHNILRYFCNTGTLLRIEKEVREGRESDRSFNPMPRKREPARLARLWPTLLPTLRILLPIEIPCYQVPKDDSLSVAKPPSETI